MEESRLKYLIKCYHANELTAAEERELNDWFHGLNMWDGTTLSESDINEMFLSFREQVEARSKPRSLKYLLSYAAAAAVLITVTSGIFLYKKSASPAESSYAKTETIVPGGNKAYLTLDNGNRISLSDAPDGELGKQAGIRLIKTSDGHITYEVSNVSSSVPRFNTIETPRGGQYQVSLPDGSRVWLNAASKLRYPLDFNGQERRVELEGEAYFEISPDKAKPFRVASGSHTVEVLGTHFNVNAYDDEESLVTTLLEGSVMLKDGSQTQIMKPGEQSHYRSGKFGITRVDAAAAVAWKNGRFIFRNEPIEQVMRKISRWYDVEIIYPGGVPRKTVWGNISKFENASQVLELIELSKVAHFKIDAAGSTEKGRRIIVME